MALSAVLLIATGVFGVNYLLFGRFGFSATGVYESIAISGRPLVQAVADYRTDHGLFPIDMSDLVPKYLATPPTPDWQLSSGSVSCFPKWPSVGISYHFTGSGEWWVVGEGINRQLNVPGPKTTRPPLVGETLFTSQLAEYEKRINRRPKEEVWYADKINFLALANRHEMLCAECERAAELFPRWWFPQIVLAEISAPDAIATRRLAAWADENQSFANYWYLARRYRSSGKLADAMNALAKASSYPFQAYPQDSQWVGAALAFDATQFAYENKNYDLTLSVCRQWKSLGPDYGEKSWLAFEAAAELALGQFDSAVEHSRQAIKANSEQAMWADNLPGLLQAAEKHETDFI